MNQKNQIALLAVLLVILAVVWYFYFHSKPTVAVSASVFSETYTPMDVPNPEPQLDILEAARKTEYSKTQRNIFVAGPPQTPVQVSHNNPVKSQGPVGPVPEPPPPPAQLPPNVKFFGYGTVLSSSSRRAFLYDGDEVHIVAEGETFLGHFRLIRIGNDSLQFEDTATNQRGSAMLEQPGPSA